MKQYYHTHFWIAIVVTFIFLSYGCKPNSTVADDFVSDLKSSDLADIASAIDTTRVDRTPRADAQINTFKLKYDSGKIDFICNLPPELLEVSGLSVYDETTLVAINDERGFIFFLDRETCEVKDKINIGKTGDFEGIEVVDNVIYVLKANGNLFPYDMNAKSLSNTLKSPLKTTNDVEGLGYIASSNKLILACKGSPDLKDYRRDKKTKAFYAFDIEKGTLDEAPLFIITDEALVEHYRRDIPTFSQTDKKLNKKINRISSFSPSAIAQHPIDGNFYILSSVGRMLIVCSPEGEILFIDFLSEKKFTQPEGICFAPDGTMYISNEGRGLVGRILRFEYF